jgi:ketosteroid isomerase-like protein
MTDLMTAEFAVRQLHDRYIDAVWRKDSESFGALFAKGAEWKIAGMHLRGRHGAQLDSRIGRRQP